MVISHSVLAPVCQSLFFGSEDIFLKTRQNLRPHLLLGAADGDSGSSESEGAIVWLALIYALLILPDNRQAALLLSELLCYLQDSAPTELLAADPSSDTFNQTPRVISRLLIKHCTYDGCIDISRIVLAGLYRYGIRSEGCANGSDDETEELFHNINILRYSILMFYARLYYF